MNSRKNNRLEFYDYSQNGAYFVTICAKDKQKIFWNNQQCSVGAVSGRPCKPSAYRLISGAQCAPLPKRNRVGADIVRPPTWRCSAFVGKPLTRQTGTGEQCSPLQCTFSTVQPSLGALYIQFSVRRLRRETHAVRYIEAQHHAAEHIQRVQGGAGADDLAVLIAAQGQAH